MAIEFRIKDSEYHLDGSFKNNKLLSHLILLTSKVAQLVEHMYTEHRVGGSSPSFATVKQKLLG